MKLMNNIRKLKGFSPFTMLFYGLIMGAAGYIIIASRAATPPPNPPTIYLAPASQTVAANGTFTVAVRENSGAAGVNAVQANISYPANLIDYVSLSSAGTAFTTEAQFSGGAGQINIARGLIGSVMGDQLIATITFKAKTVGGAANVAFTAGSLLVSSTTNTDILGSLAATAGGVFTIDTTAPAVSVTAPANNSKISGGSTVSVTVSASDASQVASVDVLIDGALKATLTTPPYAYSWNTTGVALGAHTIQAKATDPFGNIGTSTASTITLADLTAPTTSITAPAAAAKVTGPTNITASASDNAGGTGISKVEFYIDGALKSTITAAAGPYSYNWDTKTVLDGNHILSTRAYDNGSPANVGTSASVTVAVDNADHTAPSTPTGLTMSANSLTSITMSWQASTDNIGVASYRLQRNGVTVSNSSALSFTDTGLASGTSYNYSVAALDAAGNISGASTLSANTVAVKVADLNNDNKVDIFDLSILLARWGTSDAIADINRNGTVDIFDLSMLLTRYGT